MRVFFLGLIFLLSLTFTAQALTITVDGSLSDWGLNTSNFEKNRNDWDPGIPRVFVFQEDEVGNKGYVEPGYGGQKYDVEAILATFDDDYLYIAIATGFPQAGRSYGNDYYDAGDIALDLGNDGSYDYAFVISNYEDGNETRGLTVGGLYKVNSWADVLYPSHSVSNPWQMENGTYEGAGLLSYKDDPDHSFSRYFIEVGIPLDLFEEPVHEVKIHWTMECGNDYGEVVAHTPEPATLLFVGAGLFALGIISRWQKVGR